MSDYLPTPVPDSYLRVTDRTGVRLLRKDAPTLPAMPQMLPEDPTEAAYSAQALRAMMTAHSQDNAQVRALGNAINVFVFGAIMAIVTTIGWGAAFILWPAVTVGHLVLAWFTAAPIILAYWLVQTQRSNRYSSAGVEIEKIRTAERMHRDRLEARQQMHGEAVQAWQEVLTQALDKWEGL